MTKIYDFSDLQKVYQTIPGAKFNDLVMTFVSMAMKEVCDEAGSKAKTIIAVCPVNMRYPAKSIDEV
jgi:hypothetical protein